MHICALFVVHGAICRALKYDRSLPPFVVLISRLHQHKQRILFAERNLKTNKNAPNTCDIDANVKNAVRHKTEFQAFQPSLYTYAGCSVRLERIHSSCKMRQLPITHIHNPLNTNDDHIEEKIQNDFTLFAVY